MILENEQKNRTTQQLPYSGMGKLPPQAVDIEEVILGGLLIQPNVVPSVIDILHPEVFYKDNHQKVYQSISDLFNKSLPIDIITVTNHLRQRGELEMIGGAYYLTELTERIASAANIEYHARIIYQKYLQREIIRLSTENINAAYEDTTDVLDLLEKAEKDIFKLNLAKGTKMSTSITDLIKARMVEYKIPVPDGMTGIPTGITDLDHITHGWQKKDLIIIGARPSMGKTAFALQIAKHPAMDLDLPVVIFSLEMSEQQLTDRMIAGEVDINLDDLLTHNITPVQHELMAEKIKRLSDAKIFIDDTPALNIFEFRAKCRRLKADHGIQLIVVDYLQLMSGKGEGKQINREQEIGNISRMLKSVAKELNVPVIALSQLGRDVEKRPANSKRPMLSDLRESGNIEQDADLVLFLYRDEYYGIFQDANGNTTKGKVEVIIAKNRNGKGSTAFCEFNGAKMRFKDWNWYLKQQAALNFEKPAPEDIQEIANKVPDEEDYPF